MRLDIASIRRQFPLLDQTVDGKPLIYLDNAATAQKPQAVLDAMRYFYTHDNGNPHRGMHALAERATAAYERARRTVKVFLNARHAHEIVFAKNATEAINLVARSWAKAHMKPGDAVVLSLLEHHSNIVPWLQLKEEIGIDVRWIGIDAEGHLRMEELDTHLACGNVKLVSVTGLSNVLGVRPPLRDLIDRAHATGANVLIDAAQLVSHHPVDVRELDCDFLAFSGHKLYGPTGIGVLYAREDLLDAMPPFLGGGTMITEVTTDGFTAADIPAKFEAGTQPVAEAVGLGAAIEWLTQFEWKEIEEHEQSLIALAQQKLSAIDGVQVLGPSNPQERSGCISFTADAIHPHDIVEALGEYGLCLRAGHHCAQPLHGAVKIGSSSRLSVGLQTAEVEVEACAAALQKVVRALRA